MMITNPFTGEQIVENHSGGHGKKSKGDKAKAAGKAKVRELTKDLSHEKMVNELANNPKQSLYFNTDVPGTKMVPVSDLENIRARPEGIDFALRVMYLGAVGNNPASKRDPISITSSGGKKFKIADGNSTFAIAKMAGWEKIAAVEE